MNGKADSTAVCFRARSQKGGPVSVRLEEKNVCLVPLPLFFVPAALFDGKVREESVHAVEPRLGQGVVEVYIFLCLGMWFIRWDGREVSVLPGYHRLLDMS